MRRDLRLLPPAVATWAAAWLATAGSELGVPAWAWPALCWAIGAAALSGALWRRSRDGGRLTIVAIAAACAALTATVAVTGLAARDRGPLSIAAAERSTVEVQVRLEAAGRAVAAAPWADESDGWRAPATLLAVDGAAQDPLRVEVQAKTGALDAAYGSTAVLRVRVVEQPDARRAAFLLRGELVGAVTPGALTSWTQPLREGLSAAAAQLGGDGGALVPGLAIGDTNAVSDELRTAMAAASLTHLTAVSGANCAIVTAAAFWIAGRCRFPKAGRVIVALTALGAFVLLVTPESSVVRAAVMAIVVLVALGLGRAGGGVPALAVAVVLLLCADPWFSRDFGFALSVCATAGLILLSGPLAGRLARWMPRPVAAVVAVPLAAQLACQPVLVLLDPTVPVYGVAANLLAAPAAPLATVAGLVGCLLLPVLPSVGFAALQAAWLPASWIAALAHGVASLPLRTVPWLPGALGALLCAVAVAAGAIVAARVGARVRVAATAVLVLALAIPLGTAAGRPLVARALLPADWDVLQCDVGQGDAVLVRDGGATMLVDTGPDAAALGRCLDLAGVDHVDLVVVTHWDADHAGGVAAIAGRVETVLHGPLDGGRSSRALEPLVDGGAETIEVGAGASGTLGTAGWRVLWPPPRAQPGNDASVVVDLRADGYRAVFLGDLGEEAQDRLRRDHDIGRADLVKVAHHGSADQSPELYRELAATVGLVGVGAGNGYGHPTDALLDLLAASGTAVVRSDRSGSVALVASDGGFAVWSEGASPVGGDP